MRQTRYSSFVLLWLLYYFSNFCRKWILFNLQRIRFLFFIVFFNKKILFRIIHLKNILMKLFLISIFLKNLLITFILLRWIVFNSLKFLKFCFINFFWFFNNYLIISFFFILIYISIYFLLFDYFFLLIKKINNYNIQLKEMYLFLIHDKNLFLNEFNFFMY